MGLRPPKGMKSIGPATNVYGTVPSPLVIPPAPACRGTEAKRRDLRFSGPFLGMCLDSCIKIRPGKTMLLLRVAFALSLVPIAVQNPLDPLKS